MTTYLETLQTARDALPQPGQPWRAGQRPTPYQLALDAAWTAAGREGHRADQLELDDLYGDVMTARHPLEHDHPTKLDQAIARQWTLLGLDQLDQPFQLVGWDHATRTSPLTPDELWEWCRRSPSPYVMNNWSSKVSECHLGRRDDLADVISGEDAVRVPLMLARVHKVLAFGCGSANTVPVTTSQSFALAVYAQIAANLPTPTPQRDAAGVQALPKGMKHHAIKNGLVAPRKRSTLGGRTQAAAARSGFVAGKWVG